MKLNMRRALQQRAQFRFNRTPTVASQVVGTRAESQAVQLTVKKILSRQILPFFLAAGLLFLLWDKIEHLDFERVSSAVKNVTVGQWLAAGTFSALSFWALGYYDRVVHRMISSKATSGRAQRAGITAIALSQTIGMGVISSALVRWRMLHEISLAQALRISAIVSLSFLAAWAVLTALMTIIFPIGFDWISWLAVVVLVVAVILVAVVSLRSGPLAYLSFPPLRAMGLFFALTVVDTFAAGAALWMLFPAELPLSFGVLITAYLLALGAGLLSSAPGGMGAFELTLLALLPQFDGEVLLATILAFRLVYYVLPAIFAALMTVRGTKPNKIGVGQTSHNLRGSHYIIQSGAAVLSSSLMPRSRLTALISNARNAEVNLLRCGRLSLFLTDQSTPGKAMVAKSGQSLLVVSDPVSSEKSRCFRGLLPYLKSFSAYHYVSPVLYKAGRKFAAAARMDGWKTIAISQEAILNPKLFSLNGVGKRQLRRKLRKAERSGLTFVEGAAVLPLSEMTEIARRWAAKRNGERGFSMGRWDEGRLDYSRVFLAFNGDQLVGFATFHENSTELALDLMRVDDGAPDGAMHGLVHEAIITAAQEHKERLSLAAVPLISNKADNWLTARLRRWVYADARHDGLSQFKQCFAPSWETRYLCALSHWSLLMGAWDVACEVNKTTGVNYKFQQWIEKFQGRLPLSFISNLANMGRGNG